MGCSPWGCEESDTAEQLHFHFSLSCIGEGNGNPLQCSCLENPRDGGAWWAAISGVAQSRTRLKQLSSSSSSPSGPLFCHPKLNLEQCSEEVKGPMFYELKQDRNKKLSYYSSKIILSFYYEDFQREIRENHIIHIHLPIT